MNIGKSELNAAVAQNIISPQQATALYDFWQQNPQKAQFNFTQVLYYLGGLIAIGAMSIFMGLGWEEFGGYGIFTISLLYAGIALKLTENLRNKGHVIPAGITACFVIALSPLAIYGLQAAWGFWPDDTEHYRDYHRHVSWLWLYMELGTLIIAALMVKRYAYPFLSMPVAVTLWYMSMDIAALLSFERPDFELRALVSLYFGLLMLVFALWVDIRSRHSQDFAFWLYLFGVLTFWGGMTAQESDSEISKAIYCLINLLMLGIGVILMRRVFVVFGAIGVSLYIGHVAFELFKNSWFFPMALSALGLGIIYLGIYWQKHEAALTQSLRGKLPLAVQELISQRH